MRPLLRFLLLVAAALLLAFGLSSCESTGGSSSTVYVSVHGGYGYGPGWGVGWGGYYPMPPVMGPPRPVPY